MKNKNYIKYLLILFILTLTVIEFSLNDYINKENNNSKNINESIYYSKETTSEIDSDKTDNEEEVSNLDVLDELPKKLYIEVSYSNCNHTKTIVSEIPKGFSLEDIKTAYPDCEYKETLEDSIVFTKVEEGSCSEHYTIGQKDGMVAVFLNTPISNVTLKELTDIPYENISSAYKAEIEKGLNIDSNYELDLTLDAIRNSIVLEN